MLYELEKYEKQHYRKQQINTLLKNIIFKTCMFQPVIVELARSFLLPSPYIMLKRSISLVSQGSYGMVLLGYNQNRNTQESALF
jgi:hypothetical protein